jgi:hypothetical protein
VTDDRDRIREDIETTRESLSRNVDALTDTITPSAIARRQADKAGARLGGIRDRVMGTASDVSTRTSDRVGGAAGAGQALREQATGNPLAAGAIALAAGWLLGSLLPASRQERQAAATLKEKATPLVEEAKSVAAESAATLKEPASNAAAAVKESATQAAQAVRETATEAAQDVRASAQQSAQTVKDQAQG